MPQLIKASGIHISRNDRGELLLKVKFRDLNSKEEDKYCWMPEWATVRDFIYSAIIVECLNRPNSNEVDLFDRCLEICRNHKERLNVMLRGQLGLEG